MIAPAGQTNDVIPPARLVSQHLHRLCESISTFNEKDRFYVPPILDRNEKYHSDILPGLAKLFAVCKKEAEVVAVLSESNPESDLASSNAPYLFSLWDEVQTAKPPLVTINATFKSGRRDGVKVDVVAENGQKWIRTNTIKVSRLLREFREQDSYVNSDFSTDEQEEMANSSRYPIHPINSITKQCYDLALAASKHPLKGGNRPKIIYRLTRMRPEEDIDPRVQETYKCVRKMGIDLRFGPTDGIPQFHGRPTSTRHTPTLSLNLDLSLLIALISDITHAPLPSNEDEAEQRFRPMPRAWKPEVSEAGEEHFRALAGQLKQEMAAGLIDDLEHWIATSCSAHGTDFSAVQFWTTAEAKSRCEEIVSKIGGVSERRRARALFGNPQEFWKGSRHEGRGGLCDWIRVQVFASERNDQPASIPVTTFRGALARTCSKLLHQEDFQQVVPLSLLEDASDDESRTSASTPAAALQRPRRGGRRRRGRNTGPATTVRIPTAHTIRSMLEGSLRAMTTVTANRMSVKQIVRAMGTMEGLEDGGDASFIVVEPKTLGEQKREPLQGELPLEKTGEVSHKPAAIWALEPRSLAETLRTDRRNATIPDDGAMS